MKSSMIKPEEKRLYEGSAIEAEEDLIDHLVTHRAIGTSAGRGETAISWRPGGKQLMMSVICTNSSCSLASTFEDTKGAEGSISWFRE
jgi:hypothetical protein